MVTKKSATYSKDEMKVIGVIRKSYKCDFSAAKRLSLQATERFLEANINILDKTTQAELIKLYYIEQRRKSYGK